MCPAMQKNVKSAHSGSFATAAVTAAAAKDMQMIKSPIDHEGQMIIPEGERSVPGTAFHPVLRGL